MLGLKQAAAHLQNKQNSAISSGQIQFSNPTINSEFDSGIPFISGNIIVPYSVLP
jgi:hypothetical protein